MQGVNQFFALIKFQRRKIFVRVALVPSKAEADSCLCDIDIVEQYDGIGVECVLLQHVHLVAFSGKVVVVAYHGILIQCVCFQIFCADVVFSGVDFMFKQNVLSVEQRKFQHSVGKFNQIVFVAYGYVAIELVGIDFYIGNGCRELLLGFDACQHCFVAVDNDVFDLCSVNVFYCVNGVLHNAARVAHVVFQDDRLQVRTVFEHVACVLFAVQRERHNFKPVGVVDVNVYVDVLVRLGVVDRVRCADNVQRRFDFVFDILVAIRKRIFFVQVVVASGVISAKISAMVAVVRLRIGVMRILHLQVSGRLCVCGRCACIGYCHPLVHGNLFAATSRKRQ